MSQLDFACRFRYPGGFALDATFHAGDGVTALFGQSGAGKTSIFNLIAGLLRPLEGRIALGERVLVDAAASRWLPPERRGVGVVFQEQLLFPHLSVRHNLSFGVRHQAAGQARRFDFARVVELLDIGPLLDRDPAALERRTAATRGDRPGLAARSRSAADGRTADRLG